MIQWTCPDCKRTARLNTGVRHHCACGKVVESPAGPPAHPRPSRPASTASKAVCKHRGDQQRLQWCDPCRGDIKVFACELYGECTLGKKLDGIACCNDRGVVCPDFTPSKGDHAIGTRVTGNGTLRIGFVTPSYTVPGGAERWIHSVVSHRDSRVTWSGIAVTTNHHISHELIAATPCPVAVGPAAIRAVATRSDILVAWGLTNIRQNVIVDFPGRIAVISHGCGEWTQAHLADESLRADDLRIGVSSAAAASFPADVTTYVVHNGVDPSRVATTEDRETTRGRIGLAANEIAVGYVGRYSWEKNPLAAAQAAAKLGASYRAVYVGDGWKRNEIVPKIKKLCPDAILVPNQSHVGNMLAALDCFVLASPSEGMSLAIIEAWMAGIPVVSTPVGAVPELELQHGRLTTPVAIEPTAQQLATAVLRSLTAHDVTSRAKSVARRFLTSTAMATHLIDIFTR